MRAEELTLLVVVATAVVGCDEDGDNPFQQNAVIGRADHPLPDP